MSHDIRPLRWAPGPVLIAAAFLALTASGHAQGLSPADDPWPDLVVNAFDGRPMEETDTVISLDAPYRAEDAAIVPITLRLAPGEGRRVSKITLVVDENPAPVAAVFEVGPQVEITEISTRVRVNAYTNIHAVAELSDGTLHVTKKFVKASGGCSAPAGKDPEEAMANLGKMKLRQFTPDGSGTMTRLREVQLMMRHPNNSGLQIDQVTHLYIPARFIRDLAIWQGDDLVMRVTGGISISEDPNFRFTFTPTNGRTFRVEAVDTDDVAFSNEWPVEGPQPSGS